MKSTLANEDFKPYVYDDATGKRVKDLKDLKGNATIGIGHLLTPEELKDTKLLEEGITYEEAVNQYAKDMGREVDKLYNNAPELKELPPKAKEVLEDMAFNMGGNFIGEWKNFRNYLATGDYLKAKELILGSKYRKQVKGRAVRNANLLGELATLLVHTL